MTALALVHDATATPREVPVATRWEVERAVLASTLTWPQRLVMLTCIADSSTEDAFASALSLSALAKRTGLGRSTVARELATLRSAGWICADGRTPDLPPAAASRLPEDAQRCDRKYRNYGARVSPEVRHRIYERDGGRCVECGAVDDLTLDHIHPQVLGGTNDEANLRTLCRSCNSSKGARTRPVDSSHDITEEGE